MPALKHTTYNTMSTCSSMHTEECDLFINQSINLYSPMQFHK